MVTNFKFLLVAFLVLLANVSFGQMGASFENKVCSLDDVPIDPANLKSQLAPLSATDQLPSYLSSIKSLLNIPNFFIKNITQTQTACALNYRSDNMTLQRVIAINEDYYASKVSSNYLKAMYVWIIGHEITHHLRGDNFYLDESDELVNLSKELMCDENGGYLVGKLTNDIDLDGLSSILTSILKDNNTSPYHPGLRYRIYAAQAGWLRAKAENIPTNQNTTILGITLNKYGDGTSSNYVITQIKTDGKIGLFRYQWTNGGLFFGFSGASNVNEREGADLEYNNNTYSALKFGKLANDKHTGFTRAIWPDDDFLGYYENGLYNGTGSYKFYKGQYKGARFEGNFVNDKRTGFGTFYYADGSIFKGQYLNGERNGQGVYYKGATVIQSGCWKDDKFVGENCP